MQPVSRCAVVLLTVDRVCAMLMPYTQRYKLCVLESDFPVNIEASFSIRVNIYYIDKLTDFFAILTASVFREMAFIRLVPIKTLFLCKNISTALACKGLISCATL